VTQSRDESAAKDAAEGGAGKGEYVRGMFSDIAPRYDLLNHILSLNIDRAWRKRAIARLALNRRPSGRYLDICAGTLDVSVAIAGEPGFTGQIISIDFAEPMLRAGLSKIGGTRVLPVAADALDLPVASGAVSGAIVAFGIRNVTSLGGALAEVFRVLEPGATFVILEFSTPRSPLVNTAYQLYFRKILPAIGRAVSGHPTAYRYLPESVARFPVGEELAEMMVKAGFTGVTWRPLSLGIAAIHAGLKPRSASPR
jgi:demethylmenaquinone methyltransferase/2-methoxy-6-polyprenyl-1,4-benzoquinol methylase